MILVILSVTSIIPAYIPSCHVQIEVSEMSGFEEIDDCSWEGVYILNRCYDQFTDVKHPDDIEQ